MGRLPAAVLGMAFVVACGGADDGTSPTPTPATPASLQIASGQGQSAAAGAAISLAVTVLDAAGRGVSGTSVAWAVTEGGGSIGSPTTSGSDGRAQTSWTLGTRAGAQHAIASVTGLTAVTFEATAQPGALASVTVTPDTLQFQAVGDTIRCQATAADQHGNALPGTSFSWTPSDTTVVTMASTGLVRARGNGESRVVVSASGKADTVVARVSQVAVSVAISPSADTINAIGDTLRLRATARDRNGNAVPGTYAASWTSLDTAVAALIADADSLRVGRNAGVLSRSAGTARIRVQAGGADTARILVRQVAASVLLARDTATVLADSTLQLSAAVKDSNGVAISGAQLTWRSVDTLLATVSTGGLLRALAGGSTRVIASAGTPADTATITVSERWALKGYALGASAGQPGEDPSMNDVIQLPDGTYRMFYSKAARSLRYADSPDGVSWTVKGTILEGTTDPSDREYSVNGPRVLRLPDGRYRMYYQVGPQPEQGEAPRFYVRSLISQDGVTWSKEGTRIEIYPFDPSSPVEFAGHASFYRLADGTYAGIVSVHFKSELGPSDLALVRSTDGLTWTGFTQTHEDWHDPIVIPVPGGYRMYATYLLERTGTAFSADGVTWSDFTEIQLVNAAGTRMTEGSDGVGDIGGLRLPSGRIRLYTSMGNPSSHIIYFER